MCPQIDKNRAVKCRKVKSLLYTHRYFYICLFVCVNTLLHLPHPRTHFPHSFINLHIKQNLILGNSKLKVILNFLIFFFLIFGCASSSLLLEFFSGFCKWGYALVAVHRLLIAAASLAVEHGL